MEIGIARSQSRFFFAEPVAPFSAVREKTAFCTDAEPRRINAVDFLFRAHLKNFGDVVFLHQGDFTCGKGRRIADFNGIRGNIRMPHKTDFIRLLDVVEDVLQHAAGFPEMPVDYERAESHPVSLMFHPSLLNG